MINHTTYSGVFGVPRVLGKKQKIIFQFDGTGTYDFSACRISGKCIRGNKVCQDVHNFSGKALKGNKSGITFGVGFGGNVKVKVKIASSSKCFCPKKIIESEGG